MVDPFKHPDGVKAQDVTIRGDRVVKRVDPVERANEQNEEEVATPAKKVTRAGSYSKSQRKDYEKMLEEASAPVTGPPEEEE